MKTFFEFGEIIKSHTEFAIFGIPWDALTSIEGVNSNNAPQTIRDISYELALTTEVGFEIPQLKACDLGNVDIIPEEVEDNLIRIEKFIQNIFKNKSKIIPVMIGGDHFCTYPTVRAIGKSIDNTNFGILIFDSHLDFYRDWENNKYSHTTISHCLFDLDYIDQSNLLIVGTRDIDIPEKNLADEECLQYLNAYELEKNISRYTQRIINFFHKSGIDRLYISIDIDVLDPSIAPGTGYAIPGGFSYRELWQILRMLSAFFKVIGFDVVEVAPNLDLANNITSKVAAKLITEFIGFIQNS